MFKMDRPMNTVAEMENAVSNLVGNIGVGIGSLCRVEIQGRFFLLVEIEVGSGANQIEEVIVLEITRVLFNALQGSVDLCQVLNDIPTPPAGSTLELRCTFIVGNEAFIVLEIENMMERLVVVRSPLCTVI